MSDLRTVSTKTLLKRLRAWERVEGPAWLVEDKAEVIAVLLTELERRGEAPPHRTDNMAERMK